MSGGRWISTSKVAVKIRYLQWFHNAHMPNRPQWALEMKITWELWPLPSNFHDQVGQKTEFCSQPPEGPIISQDMFTGEYLWVMTTSPRTRMRVRQWMILFRLQKSRPLVIWAVLHTRPLRSLSVTHTHNIYSSLHINKCSECSCTQSLPQILLKA